VEIEKTITLVMTLEEAEDSVLTLKTLPQIEDADITFTDDGGYVVSAGLEGRTISFSSHEASRNFSVGLGVIHCSPTQFLVRMMSQYRVPTSCIFNGT
jgi:hypothetical protein